MKVYTLFMSSLAAFRMATALDWGKMSQYNSILQTLPKLSGNTIWLSGEENEGFHIVLSQDAQAKVEGVLEGCETTDDKCYQDVLDTIQSAALDVDHSIEKRAFNKQLLKVIKGPWDILADIASMLYLNWRIKSDKMDNSAFYLPQAQAEEAAKSGTSTSVVHSAGGSVSVTITPKPNPTTITGSATPSITTATAAANGHEEGDLLATLDKGLADRINEVAQRMTTCPDGREFDNKHDSRRRGDTATYGQAICAAEGVVSMSGKGGPFADLTLLSHDKIGMDFAANAEKAKEALVVLQDFIMAYSPLLAVPEDLVEQLATYILAITINALVIENVAIGPTNFIAPELAVTYAAMSPRPTLTSAPASSSTSSGCPDPTNTPLMCGWEDDDCDAKFPDRMAKGKKVIKCADGKWKGCECNAPVMSFDHVIGEDEYKGMQTVFRLLKDLEDHPVRNASIDCLDRSLAAPRSDEDANGATSVEKAVDTWCRDNDDKDVDADGIYWRWGITQLGVPNRSSFWLRAANTCDKTEKFDRWECKKALMNGMEKCDGKKTDTHGLTASISCLDYSIDLSGITDGANPPWSEKKENRKFPPPESAKKKNGKGKHKPECTGGNENPLSDSDLNKAIDAFCQDGNEIKGYGQYWSNGFDYPPRDETQFYPDDQYTMHLKMLARTVENGGPEPYEDKRWCKNYDWKLGKDDCTYALRKMYNSCSKDRAKHLRGGEYTYRCVHYKSWPINMGH